MSRFVVPHCLLMLVWASSPGWATASDPVVDAVIGHAQRDGVNGDRPDWPRVRTEADALVAASPGEPGRTAAIRYVLAALQDGHSSYRPPAAGTGSGQAASPSANPAPAGSPPQPPAGNAARGTQAPTPARRAIAGRVDDASGARLEINSWTGGGAAVTEATREVRAALEDVLAADTCGVLVDVAANGGGNMWPMMGGIAPLYDDGLLMTFEPRSGPGEVISVHDGQLHAGGAPYPRAGLATLPQKPRHVALVIGPRTASSGEILALGFKGQRNVRSFGQPTAGATTANRAYRLPNGGQLALTTSRIHDRSGALHSGPVLPDVVTRTPLTAARAWLAAQCGLR